MIHCYLQGALYSTRLLYKYRYNANSMIIRHRPPWSVDCRRLEPRSLHSTSLKAVQVVKRLLTLVCCCLNKHTIHKRQQPRVEMEESVSRYQVRVV